jgi:hypothetical protein
MIYAMLVGRTPFDSDRLEVIQENILRGEVIFPDDLILSDEAKDLVLSILRSEPSKFLVSFVF